MKLLNRNYVQRRIVELVIGGATIYCISWITHGVENHYPFWFGYIAVVIFFFLSMFFVTSLLFEKINYSGNVVAKSLWLGAVFGMHYFGIGIFLRPFEDLTSHMVLGFAGVICVIFLNFSIRPKTPG